MKFGVIYVTTDGAEFTSTETVEAENGEAAMNIVGLEIAKLNAKVLGLIGAGRTSKHNHGDVEGIYDVIITQHICRFTLIPLDESKGG